MVHKDHDILSIELVYAGAAQIYAVSVNVEDGATVGRVIRQSGILDECPEIDLNINKVGIFSEICSLDTPVYDQCRVEIYRPLVADPKQARRQRAARENSGGRS